MGFVLGLNESDDTLYILKKKYFPEKGKTIFVRNAESNDTVFSFGYIGEYITNFEIPASGVYKIEAWGASGGGTNTAPKGAYSKSFVTLNKSDNIKILVGEKGKDSSRNSGDFIYCSGGGGGSFVAKGETPLCVAGGGGGNGYAYHDSVASHACGQSGQYGGDSQSRQVALTYGGLVVGTGWSGGGGGGFRYNGQDAGNRESKGGISFLNGGFKQTHSTYSAYGGFGGGGSSYGNCGGSAGGGGYTGGGGSADYGPQGGGGGSYFTGTYGEVNGMAISGCDSFPTKPTSDLNGYVRLTMLSSISDGNKRICSCALYRFEIQWVLFATLLSS
jgi:hypothetical protein